MSTPEFVFKALIIICTIIAIVLILFSIVTGILSHKPKPNGTRTNHSPSAKKGDSFSNTRNRKT